MSGAGGTHPVPIVACGVISVCRTHIVMAAGAFLFGYRVQPITCTLFLFVADARIGIFAAGALLFCTGHCLAACVFDFVFLLVRGIPPYTT